MSSLRIVGFRDTTGRANLWDLRMWYRYHSRSRSRNYRSLTLNEAESRPKRRFS